MSAQRRIASTGPRSFERGNLSTHCTHSTRRRRFNGAAFFRARKPFVSCDSSTKTESLQRGRVLSSAETYLFKYRSRLWRAASTGPRSFERGNPPTRQRLRRRSKPLQRGRVLSSAETSEREWPLPRQRDASTGPRSFERGNRATAFLRSVRILSFNGAAFFRARKPGFCVTSLSDGSTLQRGRVLSSAETGRFALRS